MRLDAAKTGLVLLLFSAIGYGFLVMLPSLVAAVALNILRFNNRNWPFLYCLTFGAEAAWLLGLGCMRMLGYRLVSGKKPCDAMIASVRSGIVPIPIASDPSQEGLARSRELFNELFARKQ